MSRHPLLTPALLEMLSQAGYSILKSETTLLRGLRAQARGLYEGHLTRRQFLDGMRSALGRGAQQAVNEALRECGQPRNSLDRAGDARVQTELMQQEQWLEGLADFIERTLAAGDKLDVVQARLELWAGLYLRVKNLARLWACPDDNSQWLYGDTEDHCWHALTYHEQVYPNRVWLATLGPVEALPQGRGLQCRGYRCRCRLVPTDLDPTPGVPPTIVTNDYGYGAKSVTHDLVWTIALEGHYYAHPGKSVWRSAEEATKVLLQQEGEGWQLGVLMASWEHDTIEVPGQAFHELTRDEIMVPVTTKVTQ